MNSQDAIAILPLLVLTGTSVLLLLLISFIRTRGPAMLLSLVGLAAALGTCYVAVSETPRLVTPLLIVDRYALFFIGLIICATIAVVLLAGSMPSSHGGAGEFFLLLLMACLGSAVLAASNHFASFFLGLELLSVSLYALIAYPAGNIRGIEAAFKYLILAGVSSAFLLLGMALTYAETGSLQFARLINAPTSLLGIAGLGLMVVGIGFKLAVVPFHLWTPDVYQGASSPVTAFVATVSKGAMFALLLRNSANLLQSHSLVIVFACIAAGSMLVGNLLALRQTNIKRILAYSSISHLGYLLLAFVAGGPLATLAIAFYLTAYFITTLGAFGCVTITSGPDREAEELYDYEGLAWREPWVGLAMTAMFLSLAGMPITAGFIGKIYLMATGAQGGLWWLLFVLVASSLIGFAYYLRVVFAIYRRSPSGPHEEALLPIPGSLAVCTLTVLLVWLGLFPSPLVDLIQSMRLG